MTRLQRYHEWQLESRTNYVASALGVNLLIVILVGWLLAGTHPGKAPLLFAAGVAVAILVYGWVHYPRAKAKAQQAPRTTT